MGSRRSWPLKMGPIGCLETSVRRYHYMLRNIPLERRYLISISLNLAGKWLVEASWNVMAHAQKPDFVFRRNGRVHLNRRVRQFSRLLAAEVCASAVVMLDTPRSEVVWRVLATHSIRQFPLHFPSLASPCAITCQLESTSRWSEACCHKLATHSLHRCTKLKYSIQIYCTWGYKAWRSDVCHLLPMCHVRIWVRIKVLASDYLLRYF